MFRRLFKSAPDALSAAAIPAGQRVYAIGDVHGRLDLLDQLLVRIGDDLDGTAMDECALIFLGDLIDRGPDSASVIERVHALHRAMPGTRVLTGNHEEVFVRALDGDEAAMRFFCKIGGRETILSYGISEESYRTLEYSALITELQRLVPAHHRRFLRQFEDMIVIGDYAFVHAGVRPGVPLQDQEESDLRWIRDGFLDHGGAFERIIVHGHTITPTIDVRHNRIGIDTGAYAGGPLSALALEGDRRWFVDTGPALA